MAEQQTNQTGATREAAGPAGEAIKARARDALWRVWTPLAAVAARGYVAGPHLADALRASEALSRQGFTVTLCHWSPVGTEPAAVAEAYCQALRQGGAATPGWYLSVKAPELGYSRALASTVAREAQRAGLGLHFDSHGPETADPTFALIADLLPEYRNLGCTLPGRWERSQRDAERALEWGLRVRVVKGQWREPGRPEQDARRGCLAVIDRLAGGPSRVALASHDPVLVREGLTRLLQTQTHCELELLFGLPVAPALAVARPLGVPVRIYVPYGHGWLPYCFTQITRRPRIVWWLLRDIVFRRSLSALYGTPTGRRPIRR